MTARKMGQVYYDMGFLSSPEVIECSASDLVGQFVGQTGPKTRKLLARALGKVLVIDEAYRLAEGAFAREATDELVGLLTEDAFAGRLVVVLAGHDGAMRRLLAQNPGLASRFPAEVAFAPLPAEQCLALLVRRLAARDVVCAALGAPAAPAYRDIVRLLCELAALPAWGNARDVETLAQRMVHAAYARGADADTAGALVLGVPDAVGCVQAMVDERRARGVYDAMASTREPLPPLPVQTLDMRPPAPPAVATASASRSVEALHTPPPEASETCAQDREHATDGPLDAAETASLAKSERDEGVPDAVWEQLQADKQASADATRRAAEALRALEDAVADAQWAEGSAAAREKELCEQLEDERTRLGAARTEREKAVRALEERRRKEEKERKREEELQRKLQSMGTCIAGYAWVRQSDGYRCSFGTCFVTHAELAKM